MTPPPQAESAAPLARPPLYRPSLQDPPSAHAYPVAPPPRHAPPPPLCRPLTTLARRTLTQLLLPGARPRPGAQDPHYQQRQGRQGRGLLGQQQQQCWRQGRGGRQRQVEYSQMVWHERDQRH